MRGMWPWFLFFGAVGDFTLLVVLCVHYGVAAFLGAFVLPAVVGIGAVKRQGLGLWAEFSSNFRSGNVLPPPLVETFLIFAAGILLLFPGPVSSAFGILLLIKPLRRVTAGILTRRVRVVGLEHEGRPAGFSSPQRPVDVTTYEVKESGGKVHQPPPIKVISIGESEQERDHDA